MNWFSKMVHQVHGRRRDNRGLTLVELICAIAIFSMVATAAGGVLIVSAKNYQRGTVEAELQQTAQLAVNQIEDLIIDANAAPGSSTHVLRIEKDSTLYEVYLDSIERQLRYLEYTVTPGGMVPTTETQVLADNVDIFNVDMSQFAQNGNVLLHLKLSTMVNNMERSYEADFTITSRNGRYAGNTSGFAASINVVSELVLEPGENYEFPLSVEGNLLSDAVDWTLSQNTDPDTQVYAIEDGKYRIHVGLNETADTVMFTVSTQELNGAIPYAYQTVRVHIRRVNSVNISAVKNNTNYTLTANVGGTNLASMAGVPTDDLLTNYVDPYNVKWEYFITDFSGTVTGENVSNYISNITENGLTTSFNVTGNFDEYNLLVRATALHPDGANKTHLDYGDVYGEWTLYLIISGPGDWARTGDSPLFIEGLGDEYLWEDQNGDKFLRGSNGEPYGNQSIRLTWWRYDYYDWFLHGYNNNTGNYNEAGYEDENHGIVVKFSYGDPRTLHAGLQHRNTTGELRYFSYSAPYYAGDISDGFSVGVSKLRVKISIGDIAEAIAVFNIRDVIFQYRNSTFEEWSADTKTGKKVIYITPDDAVSSDGYGYYTTYFQLVGGWDETSGDDFVAFNRFVGVINNPAGYDQDVGYDLTFYNPDGTAPYTYCNAMNQHGNRRFAANGEGTRMLNGEVISQITEHGAALTVRISNEEKTLLCTDTGTVIQEIYEFNPWFTNTNTNYPIWAPKPSEDRVESAPIPWNPNNGLNAEQRSKAEDIDGCDGILEYHFVKSNVLITNNTGNKPAVMYCPREGEDGLVNGFYYISQNARYAVSGNTAEYQVNSGSGFTTQYTLTWNGSKWTD